MWQQIKNLYSKTCQIAQEVAYSDVYVAAVCLFAFVTWVLNWTVAGLVVICLLATLALLFTKNAATMFLPIVSALTVVRNLSEKQVLALIPCFVLVVVGVVVFVVRNFPKKFKLGKMFFPQVAVTVALLVGGAGAISAKNYLRALPLVLALGIGVLAIYFLALNYLKTDDVDVPLHFAKVFACVGFVISAQLLTVIMQSGVAPQEWTDCYWDVGWGNRNMIATFLDFCIIMSLYLCVRAKKFGFIYLLAAYLQTLFLLLTMSRGGILFGVIAVITGTVMCILKGNRKENLICLGAVCGAAILVAAIFHKQVGALFTGVVERFSEISIRIENGKLVIDGTSWRGGEDGLYQKALEMFKTYPIFGGGVGHVTVNNNVDTVTMDWFHSTVFEVMASMGVLGMLCYAFYYVMRLWVVFEKGNVKHRFPLFVFISWIAFEGQSLVDVGIMEPIYMIFIALQMAIMEVCVGEQYEQSQKILWLWQKDRLQALEWADAQQQHEQPQVEQVPKTQN